MRVKQILQQFFIAVVVFSVICPGNLWAQREKSGANVLIIKANGTKIKGELLKVENDSLQLMVSESLNKVSININEIDKIKIKRQNSFGKGGLTGSLIFGPLGFGVGYFFSRIDGQGSYIKDGLNLGFRGAFSGALLVGLISATLGSYKTYRVQGKSPSQIEETLNKLENLARFKTGVPKPGQSKTNKIHLILQPGSFKSQAIDDYIPIFNSAYPGNDEFLTGTYGNSIENPDIYLKNIKVEYSISKQFALGFMFSFLNKVRSQGAIIYESSDENYGGYILGESKGSIYYLTAAYMPAVGTTNNISPFKLGAGVGLSAINLDFRTDNSSFGGYPSVEFDNISFSNNFLAFIAFAQYDYYFNRHLSVGINIDYKYVPVRVEAFQLHCSYGCIVNGQYQEFYSSVIDFPGHKVNFGGFGYGFSFGIHF
jgi:hypothetical protein